MTMLIRKISRSKWNDFTIHESGLTDVGGDVVTGCLKTSKNTLSVWEVQNDTDAEIDEAILALITGVRQEKLSKIDFVLIDGSELQKYGLSFSKTPEHGDTAVADLAERYFDITNVTYSKLGVIKEIIYNNIRTINLRTERQLRIILKNALNNGRINIEKLTPKYIEKELTVFKPYVDRMESPKTEISFKTKTEQHRTTCL